MEYLVMLLDIYEEEVLMKHYIGDKIKGKDAVYLISKEFGFIERLVKNDKVDLEKYKDKSELYTLKVVHGTDYYIDLLTNKVNSDFLLMILSIQENPLDYLCSILKE